MTSPKDKLLALIRSDDISQYSYRELANMIGCKHPSQSYHYLSSLLNERTVAKDKNGRYRVIGGSEPNSLLTFAVMGDASCGVATMYADDKIHDTIRVSPNTVRLQRPHKTFVVRAVGESMNRADINGKSIETGDYVFVERRDWWDIEDKDYIVSIIDGMANIKRLYIDRGNERIVLNSQSREYFEPIIISKDDLYLYQLSGKVVDVVKGVNI